jgi:putative heme transporter
LPQIVNLGPTLRRLRGGDIWWLALGILLEAGSMFGDIVLFHGVFSGGSKNRITWRMSVQISLAGAVATKLVATAGAGGVALSVWALRAFGYSDSEVANGIVCLNIIQYGIYMLALTVVGFGLWSGVLPGPAPVGVTLIPAIFGVVVIAVVLSMLLWEQPTERLLHRRAERSKGRASRWWRRVGAVPHSLHSGLVAAIGMLRRRDRSALGAVGSWGLDIGTLWASFHAFGHSPGGAVLVMSYFVGTLGNLLPLPAGIGGVEGGMIGTFLAFGVPGRLAVVAVLAYRTISYWLPTVPGAIDYWRLRRSVAAFGDR